MECSGPNLRLIRVIQSCVDDLTVEGLDMIAAIKMQGTSGGITLLARNPVPNAAVRSSSATIAQWLLERGN